MKMHCRPPISEYTHLLSIQVMSPLIQAPLSVELALLGFVRREPHHGYEIYRRLSETPELRLIWRMKQSRLYALLTRLEEDGLLRATLEPQDRRPSRKVYSLTPAGESAFRRWLTWPVESPRELRLEFMLKLYFAAEVNPETAARLIQRQQEVCAQWLAAWGDDNEPVRPFIHAVRRYRRGHIEAIQHWLATLPRDFAPVDQPLA
jgi:DNA-binding PadR family transcriptional regulator